MRLLGVELNRLLSRRAVIVLMLLGALGIGAVAVGVLYDGRPPTGAELQNVQQQADFYNTRLERRHERLGCDGSTDSRPRCRERRIEADEFLYRDQISLRQYRGWLLPMAAVAAVVAFLFGATFVGADIASGSLGTQLLFQPSRNAVWVAKAGALLIGAAGFGAVTLGLAYVALYAFVRGWGQPIPPSVLGEYGEAVGRCVALTAVAAVLGYAVALIARHTAAALGVVAVYGLVAEALLRQLWAGSERWLLSNHVAAVVGGRFKVTTFPDDDCYRLRCRVIFHFSPAFAACYLGAGAAVVLAISWLVFRRRDVP